MFTFEYLKNHYKYLNVFVFCTSAFHINLGDSLAFFFSFDGSNNVILLGPVYS